MKFKIIDLLIQLLLPVVIAVISMAIYNDIRVLLFPGILILYITMGAWQLTSFVIHFVKNTSMGLARNIYAILLPLALAICVYPFLVIDEGKAIYDGAGNRIFFAMIVGFFMAVFYFFITAKEFRALYKTRKTANTTTNGL